MPDGSAQKPIAENWENEGGNIAPPAYAEALGVTRAQREIFVVGGYTYTSLADAIPQGRRMPASQAGS